MTERVTFGLNKLVRDKLPETMQAIGQEVELTPLDPASHADALRAKVAEELAELDPASDSYARELADLKQAILDLIELSGDAEEVERLRLADLEKRGGFLAGHYIAQVYLQPDDPWVEYYRKDPKRYPETS
jgi:predicted house-cleaning noncanonical NTP pyrophosphatase (MazG superfamily)